MNYWVNAGIEENSVYRECNDKYYEGVAIEIILHLAAEMASPPADFFMFRFMPTFSQF